MILTALVVCGACMFTSCSDDKDSVSDYLPEKIIGKWIVADLNGEPAPTNRKSVYTFVSTTKAYMSASFTHKLEIGKPWNNQIEADVAIDGNKITITMQHEGNLTVEDEYIVSYIDDTKLFADFKVTAIIDGVVMYSSEYPVRLEKITADYRAAVLGLWECTELTGGETYNDANARLEFFADGTYKYWRKNGNGDWEAVTTREFQDYFADGTLLATRWKNQGEDELREWWEISSMSSSHMVWKALRQNADGTTFEQEMKWKRVLME